MQAISSISLKDANFPLKFVNEVVKDRLPDLFRYKVMADTKVSAIIVV
jgi:hypothetical protein